MICPYEEDKSKCALYLTGMKCQMCIERGYNDEAVIFVNKKDEIEKHWRWFRKWFDSQILDDQIYICEGTLSAWKVVKAGMDGVLKTYPVDNEMQDVMSIFKVQLVNEVYKDLNITEEIKTEKINYN